MEKAYNQMIIPKFLYAKYFVELILMESIIISNYFNNIYLLTKMVLSREVILFKEKVFSPNSEKSVVVLTSLCR